MDVDDFIDHGPDTVTYARFALLLMRLPAINQIAFKELIAEYKLFCTFEGNRYRVTGASRMGDIWLHSHPEATVGYEKRVDVADCSSFSKSYYPERNPNTYAEDNAANLTRGEQQ
jgi:hypothetical protein